MHSTNKDRSEQEPADYRDTQDYLLQQDWRPLKTGLLHHVHRLLFSHTAVVGCSFKGQDNLVVDRAPDGTATVRFKPVSASKTPDAVEDLIERYGRAILKSEHHSVLLTGLFILDLLVIQPFEDGNGRVARALTSALLIDRGYTVGRYVSLEQAVYDSSEAHYQALLESAHGWHDGAADPWPWCIKIASGRDRAVRGHPLLPPASYRRVRCPRVGSDPLPTRPPSARFPAH